jgi:glycosyltransferase involved in cell wall biosynthesis
MSEDSIAPLPATERGGAIAQKQVMKSDKKVSRLLILPHWRKGGGSGFYTQKLIDNLKDRYCVSVAGIYAVDFDKNSDTSGFLDDLGSLSLPVYDGVGKLASLYRTTISLFKILWIFIRYSRRYVRDTPAVIVFTSSIQAISIPIARHFFPKCKIAIVIQETVDLSSLFGGVLLSLLRRSNVVVSITSEWAVHARKFGVDSVVIRNQYNPSFFFAENNLQNAINSDLLYIGGGAKIKGFDIFLKMLPTLLKRRDLRIVCLGEYGERELQSLENTISSSKSSSTVDVIGHVLDSRPYLRGTKLLLLPISRPHFCRPAIEAGFFEKTFIISAHSGLEDFVQDGVNCVAVNNLSGDAFASASLELLDDSAKLKSLAVENRRNSMKFIDNESEFESLITKLQ